MKEKADRKIRRFLTLSTVLFLSLTCLSACGSQNASEGDTAPAADAQEDTATASDRAMENFAEKLGAADYVVDAKDFCRTTVSSQDLVFFSYADEQREDYALITLDQETFRVLLEEDRAGEAVFLSTDNAVQAASLMLPSSWLEEADGNLFNLFFGHADTPLEFVTEDDTVKTTLMALAGYGEAARDRMQEVHMVLDAEDPSSVRFTAVVEDNPVTRIYFDDLDLTLRFGSAEKDDRIEAWIADPVYPRARTGWTEDDIFFLNSVFMPGYGQDALPFPDFASYAMTLDQDVFASREAVYYTDPHGTQEDLDSYIGTLQAAGFSPATETLEDGSDVTVYRRPLREDYQCYVSVYPHMEKGFVLEAECWYDEPSYDSLEAIDRVLEENGFAALADSENLDGWTAADHAASRSESWLYFFDYDMYLTVNVRYRNAEEADAWIRAYGDRLAEMGYLADESSKDPESGPAVRYESPDGSRVFRCGREDASFVMEFRSEKLFSAEEAGKKIADAGIPGIELPEGTTARDISRYHKISRDFRGQLYLAVSAAFGNQEEAEAFLDRYTARLEDAGYFYTSPEAVGTLKQFAYYNEEEDKIVSFDFIPQEDEALVNFDFISNS